MAHEGFFPPSPFFLLTGARSQHVRIPAAGRTSKLVRAESFLGGIVGIAEHDAQPFLKISSCVISESKRTIFSVSRSRRRLLGVQAAGRTKELVRDESFFWGGLVGNHVGVDCS